MDNGMKQYAQYFFWVVALLSIILLVNLFRDVLLPFVLGGAIAYLLNPIVEFLIRKGVRRQSAVLCILGLFFAGVVSILLAVSPVIFREAGGFIAAVPTYIEKLRLLAESRLNWLQSHMGDDVTDQIQTALQENVGKALTVGKGIIGGITTGSKAFIDFITTVIITPIAAFFFMREWPHVVAWAEGLIPRQHLSTVHMLLRRIDGKISGFVRGQTSVCAALGTGYAIALSVAGLQYGFVIGLATGLLSFIPFVGSTLGLVTSVMVAYFQTSGDWSFVGIVAAIFFAGQFIEGNFITPKVMGDSVGLHPLWIIFALMAGGSLMGIVGMFLAVPVAASVGVLAGFAISEYKKSRYFCTGNGLIQDDSHANPA